MKVIFEIFYEDLTEIAQHYLCRALRTTSDKENGKNWGSSPLAVVERELGELGESNGAK